MQALVRTVSDRTLGWAPVEPAAETLSEDGLTLVFEPARHDAAQTVLRIVPGTRLRDAFGSKLEVPIPGTAAKLAGAVADCHGAWWHHVIEGKAFWSEVAPDGPLFTRYAYHAKSDDPVPASVFEGRILPELAQAGERLFVFLFRPSGPRYAATREVGEILRKVLLEAQGLRILVRSDDFQAPWNLLYLGDDPRRPSVDAFLGARHIVEHDFADAVVSDARIALPSDIALHLDEDIDRDERTQPYAAIASFCSLLRRHGISWQERNSRQVFLDALRDAAAAESIFYFLCHAEAGDDTKPTTDSIRLYLTRAQNMPLEPVVPLDIQASLDRHEALAGQPLVFINACRAVKSGSIFYDGFASQFLAKNARSIVGPEIEMPVVFARDFAANFFEEFFRGGTSNSVGQVLLRLRRRYLANRNPLGLAYSLYRGSNVYLPVGAVAIGAGTRVS